MREMPGNRQRHWLFTFHEEAFEAYQRIQHQSVDGMLPEHFSLPLYFVFRKALKNLKREYPVERVMAGSSRLLLQEV
ncbi:MULTISPECIES: hypothetical protein [unclassified Akkermansia]|uniref:hypothetical protein n=1 Tax=unclassified Akkermansia TaxID=2608915 RepID=UPI0011C93C70|nr:MULTISPECIES: hypothetical protein [unclassified Akkermansia]